MSNNAQQPTASGSSASDPNSDTTTVTALVELPFDAGADDIRYEMLDDYEKCLGRHDVTLNDLLRIHQRQQKSTMKLTLNLEQAKKREENERKKSKELEQLLKDLVKGMNDLNKSGEREPRRTPEDSNELKNIIDDLKNRAADLRRRRDDVDKRFAEAKAKEAETGDADDGQKAKREKELENELNKLAHDLDQLRGEIYDILHAMNLNLAKLNRRLSTDYKVNEDPDTTIEVRTVLDTVLFDVSNMFEGKRRLEADLEELKRQIAELEKHILHAEKMLAFLDREIVKLLAIGGRKEAADVDKKNYGQVIKFVEETFDILLKKLKDQNKEIDERNKRREEIEAEIERRRKLHDEETAKKRDKLNDLKRQIDKMNFQNEMLRNELRRTPSEPETKIHTESKIDIDAVKSSQIAAESQQIVVVENQLKRAKDKNDEALKQLNDLTDQINDKDDRLNEKRKELDDLKEKFNRRKADEDRKADRLELEIAELTREIERLGNELDNAKKLPRAEPSEQIEQVPRKDGELEEPLRRAEADRAELLNQLNKLQDEYRNACDELKRGKDRRREIEDQLQDVLNDIDDIQRKLNRRKDSAPQTEYDVSHTMAQPLQFQHTTVTRIEGAGGSRTEQIVSGSQLPGPQKSPTSSAKDKGKDGDKRSSPSTQFGTQASVSDPQHGSGSAGAQPGGVGYDEQICSLQESKRLAESRRDSLQRKVEKARPKSQSPSTEGKSGSSRKSKPSKTRRSRSSSRSSKGPGSSAANEIRSEQAPMEKQKSQKDVVQETPKRRRSRSRSSRRRPVQIQIASEFQMEKRDGDKDANAKLYEVKGDLVLMMDPSTTTGESSTVATGAESATPKPTFSGSSASGYPPSSETPVGSETKQPSVASSQPESSPKARRRRGSSSSTGSDAAGGQSSKKPKESKRKRSKKKNGEE